MSLTNTIQFLPFLVADGIIWFKRLLPGVMLHAMKTLKRIPIGIINIATNPHADDGSTYIELFQAAFNLNQRIKIKADQYAYIATCGRLDESDTASCLTGEIHKFTEISGDWENLQKRKAATFEDAAQISIPDHLKPNRESFRYFLFPKEHRLVFQMLGVKRRISHAGVKHLLEELFSSKKLKEKFPLVSVTIEQEPEPLERILKLPYLYHLHIHIQRPNPDSISKEELMHIEQQLREQGARSLDIQCCWLLVANG